VWNHFGLTKYKLYYEYFENVINICVLVKDSFKNRCGMRIMFKLYHFQSQLNEHVRTQVLTPQCPHLFNTTTYETTHLLLHVQIYLQFRSGQLCNHLITVKS